MRNLSTGELPAGIELKSWFREDRIVREFPFYSLIALVCTSNGLAIRPQSVRALLSLFVRSFGLLGFNAHWRLKVPMRVLPLVSPFTSEAPAIAPGRTPRYSGSYCPGHSFFFRSDGFEAWPHRG